MARGRCCAVSGGLAGAREAVRPDEVDVLVRLLRVDGRRLARQRGRHVEDPVAGVGVPAGLADVARRAAHDLEELRVRERRPLRPDRGGGTGDERGGEARAVDRGVAGRIEERRDRAGHVLPGRGEVHRRRGAARTTVTRSDSSVAPTVSTCAKVAGYDGELPCSPVVPGRGDDQLAGAEGVQDRVLLDRQPVEAAEAEVDHAAAVSVARGEARDLVADGQLPGRARVPELELRLRVDRRRSPWR